MAAATGSPPIAKDVLNSGIPSASTNFEMNSMLSLICLANSRDGTIMRPKKKETHRQVSFTFYAVNQGGPFTNKRSKKRDSNIYKNF